MPAELKPQSKRRANMKPSKVKKLKVIPTEVVEQKLKILEQKELENPDGERSVKGDNDSDEDVERVSVFNYVLRRGFNYFYYFFRRKRRTWKIKRWTTRTIMETAILTMVKGSMMKTIIWMMEMDPFTNTAHIF